MSAIYFVREEKIHIKKYFLRRGMKQTSLNKTNNNEEGKEENQNLTNLSEYLFEWFPFCFLMKCCGCFSTCTCWYVIT